MRGCARFAEERQTMSKRVVVVTGAGAGVGRAAARAFAARGDKVALLARDLERLQAAAGEVREAGGEAVAIPVDVADAAAVDDAAEQVERSLGPIDVWVNAAMATVFAPFHSITPAEFRRATEVTYLGFVHGTMASLKRMRARNRGTIVQVGSALAYRSVPLQSAYCGAKAAIRGFTDSIRSELIHDKLHVHITMVHMPALNTPQFDWARNKMRQRPQPVPPIFQPEVAARAIVFAASARRREIYVGGPTLKAVYAHMVVPGLLDRFLAKKGYSGQLTDERERPGRPDNLFEPVAGDYKAHGRFDARATDRSLELWTLRHRGWAALTLGLLALAAAAVAPRVVRSS
jgi:NAD(P)-dependent dehydrogenase (short-subunit alcohol dehydrogenase family)